MGLELRGWWLREMVATPSPLTERMTLFWHNHFVSGAAEGALHAVDVSAERRCCANTRSGVFDDAAACRGQRSGDADLSGLRDQPAWFAKRELCARGDGALHPGEGRVQAKTTSSKAARAFTGWSIDLDSGDYMFRRPLHDGGEKTYSVETGNFDGDAVLDILLAQPASAEFIVRKLWREFVRRSPMRPREETIAAQFRAGGWNIAAAGARASAAARVIARDQRQRAGSSLRPSWWWGLLRQSGGELTRPASGRGRAGRHGTEPVFAAQCTRLARRRRLDQHPHAASA